jgi:tetratricopeptide (TPR) repeat protein
MDIGDPKIEALLALAGLEGKRGNRALARQYYETVRDQATWAGNSVALSIALHELAMLFQQEGKLENAEQLYLKSLELCVQLNDNDGAARTNGQLGKLKELQGDLSGASSYYLEAFTLFEKVNSPMKEKALMDALQVSMKMRRAEKRSAPREGLVSKLLRWLRIK